jgi:predicted RNase H-like HicB family nuclease
VSDTIVKTYTAYIEQDPDSGLFVGSVPGLPGAHSQGQTLDELGTNLREVITLVLEERRARGESLDVGSFVGVQQITVRL